MLVVFRLSRVFVDQAGELESLVVGPGGRAVNDGFAGGAEVAVLPWERWVELGVRWANSSR